MEKLFCFCFGILFGFILMPATPIDCEDMWGRMKIYVGFKVYTVYDEITNRSKEKG